MSWGGEQVNKKNQQVEHSLYQKNIILGEESALVEKSEWTIDPVGFRVTGMNRQTGLDPIL